MSHNQNTAWLEAALEHFEEAVQNGEWDMAQAIIADVHSNGFKDSAVVLQRELEEKQNEKAIEF